MFSAGSVLKSKLRRKKKSLSRAGRENYNFAYLMSSYGQIVALGSTCQVKRLRDRATARVAIIRTLIFFSPPTVVGMCSPA